MAAGPAVGAAAVLYDDAVLAAVDKPAGVYSEHVLASMPAVLHGATYSSPPPQRRPPPPAVAVSGDASASPSGSSSDSCHFGGGGGCSSSSSALAPQAGESGTKEASPPFYLVHRLDRDTSGVLMIAKGRAAAGAVGRTLANRSFRKFYVALCGARAGSGAGAPSWARQAVATGHGRSRGGLWRVYALEDVGRMLPGGSCVKRMDTAVEVLAVCNSFDVASGSTAVVLPESSGQSDGNGGAKSLANTTMVLLRATPTTGRTHQIRLHCQHLGLPIAGDVRYGGLPRSAHALHAESVAFNHPTTAPEMPFRTTEACLSHTAAAWWLSMRRWVSAAMAARHFEILVSQYW
eukprot:SM000005S17180  [mRNA]  locus=s5:626707:628375:+ [translate_table: standard]